MEQDLALLNRQAIAAAKQYMGTLAVGTVVLTLVVLLVYVGSLWLALAGAVPLWCAFLVLSAFTYLSYTPVHEAVHTNISGERPELKWLNDLCGYLCAQLIMVPYSSHKTEHFTHHRFTNVPDKDPDFVVSGMANGPLAFVSCAVKFLWTQITFMVKDHWATASWREQAIYCAEVSVALTWRIALLILLPVKTGLMLVVAPYVVGVVFTAYWFAYRPHHPYQDAARYRNTSSLIMPVWMKPLEWFWLGQNLHSIHHAFPRVPFYRYHALFREIEPALRAHGNPVIGIFDRRPVPAAQRA